MDEILDLKRRLCEQRPSSWEGMPDIALYMDQVLALLNRQTIRFGEDEGLTAAMINNYIKDGAAPRAAGKRYHENHLAYLTMISVLKQVLPVKDVTLLTRSWMDGGELPEQYEKLCGALDEALHSADDKLDSALDPAELAETAVRFALLSYSYGLVSRRLTALVRAQQEEGTAQEKHHRKKKDGQEA